MDKAEEDKLTAYLQREKTFLGRATNIALDAARTFTGKKPLLLEALTYEHERTRLQQAASVTPDPATGLDPISEGERALLSQQWAWDVEALDADLDMKEREAHEAYERSQGRDPDAPWPVDLAEQAQSNSIDPAEIAAGQAMSDAYEQDHWPVSDEEPDYEAMCYELSRNAEPDPATNYAEAYADVAGDATLSWRLEDEDPLDILDDVRREATQRAGLMEPDVGHKAVLPSRQAHTVDLIIAAMTVDLKQPSLEQDNAPERGVGR